MRQRIVHINIVHIEGVLRQLHLAQLQHFRAVDDRMHEDILIQSKTSDVIPAENLVFREHIIVRMTFLFVMPTFS